MGSTPVTREQRCAELLQMQADVVHLLSQPLHQAAEKADQRSVGTPPHETHPVSLGGDESESDFEDDSEDDAGSWPSASTQLQRPLSFFQPQSPVDTVIDVDALRARLMDEVHSVLHAALDSRLQYLGTGL